MDLVEINSCPSFLVEMLIDLNTPNDCAAISQKYRERAYQEAYDIDVLLQDLMEYKIISTVWEQDRYDRHRLFLDMAGMDHDLAVRSLQQAKIGIIGAGGIGSNVATLLAAAGIGYLRITDGDRIELSNLTRTTAFVEAQIGLRKADALKARIFEHNSTCQVVTLPRLLEVEALDEFCSFLMGVDLVLLSADPPNAFELMAEIQKKISTPVINAGYLGRLGAIGPMFFPDSDFGFDVLAKNTDIECSELRYNINKNYQAPSYGPLNYLVSSICAHEVIKYVCADSRFLHNKRLFINPDNYEVSVYDYISDEILLEHSNVSPSQDKLHDFDVVAENYVTSREVDSLNKILLDDIVNNLLIEGCYRASLDIGCGIGTYSRILERCSDMVVGIDTNQKMLDRARELGEAIEYLEIDINKYKTDMLFDCIVLSLVLDHICEYQKCIEKVATLAQLGAKILCILPNPVKDSCVSGVDKEIILKKYFYEGKQIKTRLNKNGSMISHLTSYKRTLSSYINAFLEYGFVLKKIVEPQHPDPLQASHHVPYFTVLEFRYG
ncbi:MULTISPECIES: ThiF family adenylyltransferase [unclassified Bartonella]|uniref:ThiF family adenylyltransferase n=1 Tax=unclassified Bartonella TaxID=2645622 RepID=UPI0035CFE92C